MKRVETGLKVHAYYGVTPVYSNYSYSLMVHYSSILQRKQPTVAVFKIGRVFSKARIPYRPFENKKTPSMASRYGVPDTTSGAMNLDTVLIRAEVVTPENLP
jgi:hypothetical protein